MASFTSKFQRCFYEMSKELFEVETKPTRAGQRQYFDVFAFFCTMRVPFVVYVMYVNYEVDGWWWYNFRQNDILVSYLFNFRSTLDYTTFLMIFFFDVIYFILSYWCFKLDVQGRNWRFWYQMTVLSLDQYYECRLSRSRLKRIQALKRVKYEERLAQFSLPGSLVRSVSGALASAEMAARMEDVDVPAMQSRPLPAMPFLSWKARAKALRLMLITEAFAYVFQIAVAIIYIISVAALAYIYPHWDRHPWYIIVYEFIEMIWPLVFFIWLIRYIILFTTLTILGTLVFTTHVNEWQDKVKGWLKQFNYSKAKAPKRLRVALPLSGRLLLERFLREHNLVTYLVVSCSGELWGKIILATICTQIPINVIFVRKMFVSVSGDDEALSSLRYILFLICFVQLLLFAIIFLPLGWCQKVYHSPKKFIPRFLLLSTGSGAWWWTLRLKYNDLYGRLMRGPKFALSVGELHAITYLSAMEFLFSYIAYLLMAFSTENIV